MSELSGSESKPKTNRYLERYIFYKKRYLVSLVKQGGGGQLPANCRQVSYFFDNDPYNFHDKHLCPCILPVPIMESDSIATDSQGQEIYATRETYQLYCHGLTSGAQKFGEAMLLLGEATGYDPLSGISPDQLKHFLKLVTTPNPQPKIAAFIFDWDRTLTVVEGIYSIKPTVRLMLQSLDLASIRVKDVAEYYLGGRSRYHLLRQLWKALSDQGIEIWVISSNPSIGEFPLFFLNLLESVGLHLPANRLVYRDKLTKYQYMERHLLKQGTNK
jgi:hypothetical protein